MLSIAQEIRCPRVQKQSNLANAVVKWTVMDLLDLRMIGPPTFVSSRSIHSNANIFRDVGRKQLRFRIFQSHSVHQIQLAFSVVSVVAMTRLKSLEIYAHA